MPLQTDMHIYSEVSLTESNTNSQVSVHRTAYFNKKLLSGQTLYFDWSGIVLTLKKSDFVQKVICLLGEFFGPRKYMRTSRI